MSRIATTNNNNNMKMANGNNSNIPLRRSLNRTNSNSSTHSLTSPVSKIPINNNAEAYKWRQKYDEAEERRKSILTEKEKTLRQYNDLHREHLDLQMKNEQLDTELFEKNEALEKLRTISETLFKEYQMLKNQYDTETGAMSRALKDASGWYKENKELKRRTMFLPDGDTVDEGVDAGDSASSDSDIDNLNKTIKQLSTEIAELQTEVDSLKHIEFQTTEQNIKLTEEVETEKAENERLRREVAHLRQEHEQLKRVTDMMKKEMQDLHEKDQTQRHSVDMLRKEADKFKKERNVLAHQSTLLLQNIDTGDFQLLDEIEQLKRAIEDERTRHEEEIRILGDKVEVLESNSQIELLEERLKLAESEVDDARRRASEAEVVLENLRTRVESAEVELEETRKRAAEAEEELKKARAPPPPPPPPPLKMLPQQPPPVPLRVKRKSRANLDEIAEAFGGREGETAENKKPNAGVNDDIINAIKQGQFTLKKAAKEKKEVHKEREVTKTVSELLNVLGSLRRTPKNRQSQVNADIEL